MMKFGVMGAFAATLMVSAFGAKAAPVVTDLSSHTVAITANFSGSDILLFGATQGEKDVIVIVRGPRTRRIVRRKEHRVGIWINGASQTFEQVPSFYAVASTRPVTDLLPASKLESFGVGADHITVAAIGEPADGVDVKVFTRALFNNMRKLGLYNDIPAPVRILGDTLFRVSLHFPTNVPVGTYEVEILLVRDRDVVTTGATHLEVGKTGIEAGVYDFAHRYPPAYGVVAILIAVLAGWLASVAFRKS